MDVVQKIDELMKEHNWSSYKLSAKSGLSTSTLSNLHTRNTTPSIPTLEAICKAFGITLSQFFQDETSTVHLNDEQLEFFNKWVTLTKEQKKILNDIIKEFK
ncbi:MAG: helix-turn-helix transcriptional regulator [Lachnospiraceae bacterium]|nr:helix-turn-helix transcriptional regulator [Lachnospiraceae bacterium]